MSNTPFTYVTRSAAPLAINRRFRAAPSQLDTVANFGLLKGRAKDTDTISDKDSLYYSFSLDRVSKVRATLENNLKEDFFSGFLKDRSFFGRFLDVSGKKIGADSSSVKPEDDTTFVSRRLKPGTYYLELKSNYSGDIRYQMQLRPVS